MHVIFAIIYPADFKLFVSFMEVGGGKNSLFLLIKAGAVMSLSAGRVESDKWVSPPGLNKQHNKYNL